MAHNLVPIDLEGMCLKLDDIPSSELTCTSQVWQEEVYGWVSEIFGDKENMYQIKNMLPSNVIRLYVPETLQDKLLFLSASLVHLNKAISIVHSNTKVIYGKYANEYNLLINTSSTSAIPLKSNVEIDYINE